MRQQAATLAPSCQVFLVGAALTLADIALVAYTRMAADGGFALSDYPSVEAWVGRVEAELPIRESR